MPLSWNEIRACAADFAKDWKDAHYEKGESQSFYNDFFRVFGRRRRDVAVYEKKVKMLNDTHGFIDLFWPGYLLVEQKSAGRSLAMARAQATDYFLYLKDREKPRYILLSDFRTFEMLDLDAGEEHRFPLAELPDKVHLFDFIAGYHHEQYRDQDPVNIEAAALMRGLHQQLEESGYTGTHLERLLVRIMFCLFADDTGIFEPDSFLRYIEDRTGEDGSDLGSHLVHLFEVLDMPEGRRQKTLDEDLARFPYVNGLLFADLIRTPSFNSSMRESLLQCCYFNWSKVSPALFGSLFQTVMQEDAQHKGGAHYTSERNILKVIRSLFFDELREEFERIKADRSTRRRSQLETFHEKLGTLTFLDPACGCGNFLILAYRELRMLEIDVLEALHPRVQSSRTLDVSQLSVVDVDQFYGIEIEEFPARIAEAAMWLVDHQMNMKLSEAFGHAFVRLPLKTSAHIVHANALRLDWHAVVAPANIHFILGNPPFVAKHLMTDEQGEEMDALFRRVDRAGLLDYVTAWYLKAAQYIQDTTIKCTFVSTNSISQGEQVSVLWQTLLRAYSIKIHFAHRTFKWTIDEKRAQGMKIAAVYVVIIGFAAVDAERKYLFEYETVTSDPHRVQVKNINPYLVEGNDVVISPRKTPVCAVPEMLKGSQPTDDGNFLFSDEEKAVFLLKEPQAAHFIRPLLSTKEYLHAKNRWCLWLKDVNPSDIRRLPLVMERVEKIRKFRLASKKVPTQKSAQIPTLFSEIRQPQDAFILIPRHTSENRQYIPFGFFGPDNIVHDSCNCIPHATLYHFGVLTSQMHMQWMRHVCGRLEGRPRYSNTLVYNTFPWPEHPTEVQVQAVERMAQLVLDVRAQFPQSSLADLYNPLLMPPVLLRAHRRLDRAVDAAYGKPSFASGRQHIEFLFNLYQKYTSDCRR